LTRKVFIIGYYGAGNAGDEAILEGMLGDLRARIPNLRPVIASADPAATSRAYNVGSVSNRDRSATMAAAKECDFIILGGGGLLHDYWDVSLGSLFSRTGGALSYYSHAALAALYSKPLILYAIGVGPLSTRTGRLYSRMVAELAQLITVRDEQSKALLVELGIDAARVHVAADPAFVLTYPISALDLPRPILGVALRPWSIGIDPETWEAAVTSAPAWRVGSRRPLSAIGYRKRS
jgi:polysaccharide pyruvyl transferase WcaK-like protein